MILEKRRELFLQRMRVGVGFQQEIGKVAKPAPILVPVRIGRPRIGSHQQVRLQLCILRHILHQPGDCTDITPIPQ